MEEDWKDLTGIRIERSNRYANFVWEYAVTIYRHNKLVLPDMSVKILEHCHFPKLLCEAARLTSNDGKVRTINADGSITARTPLYVPPPKPSLVLPKPKPKLTLAFSDQEED